MILEEDKTKTSQELFCLMIDNIAQAYMVQQQGIKESEKTMLQIQKTCEDRFAELVKDYKESVKDTSKTITDITSVVKEVLVSVRK